MGPSFLPTLDRHLGLAVIPAARIHDLHERRNAALLDDRLDILLTLAQRLDLVSASKRVHAADAVQSSSMMNEIIKWLREYNVAHIDSLILNSNFDCFVVWWQID